jgi:hypothetical protein
MIPFRAQGEVPVVSIIGMTTDGNTLGQKMSRPESATSRRPAPHFRGAQHGDRGASVMLAPSRRGRKRPRTRSGLRANRRRPQPRESSALEKVEEEGHRVPTLLRGRATDKSQGRRIDVATRRNRRTMLARPANRRAGQALTEDSLGTLTLPPNSSVVEYLPCLPKQQAPA